MSAIARKFDQNIFRILEDGKCIGFASRLSNERWIAVDEHDKRLSKQTFNTPFGVAKWFDERSNT
jgi:hypothetical protein